MKISIVGAGTAGLIFAYALLKSGRGFDVTLYSDRTADQWLNDVPPTGTAALYGETIDIERELGMDHWSDTSAFHAMHGVLFDFKPTIDGPDHLQMAGHMGRNDGGAVDMRMRVHRWLNDLESIGGRLVIEAVTPERLDAIAADSDLTVLAAGKANLARIIPRDPERSIYDKPQRKLCMFIADGIAVDQWDDRADFTPVKFNFYGDTGEYFWVPFTHKTAGKTWCALFEAKPGGKMDVFDAATSAREAVDIAKKFIAEHAPWEWDIVRNMRAIEGDPHCWLKGAFAPTVRQAYGTLPSGGLVMPIGDTAMTFDPIGGQGGNAAQRNARFVADAVLSHDGPFDAAWMEQVRNGFWDYHGRAAYTFNNILLEPLTEAGMTALGAAAASREFADRYFIGSFTKPNCFFPWIEDVIEARKVTAPYLPIAAE